MADKSLFDYDYWTSHDHSALGREAAIEKYKLGDEAAGFVLYKILPNGEEAPHLIWRKPKEKQIQD